MIIQSDELVVDPVVSVVVTSYNRADTIAQTLNSILIQKCSFKFEIIIGDDFSTDGTRDILRQYESMHSGIIRLLLQEQNLGVGPNWAHAVSLARGKYIATCDDDDYWHFVQKLQVQVEHMENNEECVMLHTDKDNLYVKKNKLVKNVNSRNPSGIKEGYIQGDIFRGQSAICFSTCIFRAEIIRKNVNLGDFISLKFGLQDWPIWIIISHYGRIDYISTSTCTYRIGHFAITNLNDYEKQLNKMLRDKVMYKYLCELFPNKLRYVERDFDIHTYKILLNMAYKKNDFRYAQDFGIELNKMGTKNMKTVFSKNQVSFFFLSFLLQLKRNTNQLLS